jgi:hypothetical protein
MNSKALALAGMALALGLAGCNEIEGVFSSKVDVTLKTHKNKSLVVPKGDYASDIEIDTDDKEATLSMKVADRSRKFIFRFAKEIEFGEGVTAINIPSAESGQPVDLIGEVNTTVKDGPLQGEYETCWTDAWVKVCHEHGQGKVSCYWKKERVPGQMWVEYIPRTITRTVALDLTPPQKTTLLAEFNGQRKDSQRIYRYQGMCLGR